MMTDEERLQVIEAVAAGAEMARQAGHVIEQAVWQHGAAGNSLLVAVCQARTCLCGVACGLGHGHVVQYDTSFIYPCRG